MSVASACRMETAGSEGVDFQLNIISWILLRAHKLYKENFQIFSELQGVGKFDDVVLMYKDKKDQVHYRFLQAKHVKADINKSISLKDLTIGSRFNVLKYFESFKEIKCNDQFKDKIQDVILFTNLDVNKDVQECLGLVTVADPVFDFSHEKRNLQTPHLYKLKASFIERHRDEILRNLANGLLDNCELGQENINKFKEYHDILSKDVINVNEKSFRLEFIERQNLVGVTKIFRTVFDEELLKRHEMSSTIEWMYEARLNYSSSFGGAKEGNWPTLLEVDIIDKEEFTDFCTHFILALNQPNEQELETYLESENKLGLKVLELRDEIRRWYKSYDYPLNNDFLNELVTFQDINQQLRELANQQIEFIANPLEAELCSFLSTTARKLLLIEASGDARETSIKLHSLLKKYSRLQYLFTPRVEKDEMKNILHMFSKSKHYHLLIWETHNSAIDYDLLRILDLPQKEMKRLIVVGGADIEIIPVGLELNAEQVQHVADEASYSQLTEETQKRLQEKLVSFQGCAIKINEIYPFEAIRYESSDFSWVHLLESNISIGEKVNFIQENERKYYVNRTLTLQRPYFDAKDLAENLGEDHFSATDEELFEQLCEQHPTKFVHLLEEQKDKVIWRKSATGGLAELLEFQKGTIQESISDRDKQLLSQFDSQQKVFLITDPAGMGKSTISSHLATEFKKQHPDYWIIRLVAVECASKLDCIDCPHDDFITTKLLRLTRPIERFLFEQCLRNENSKSKLIFIFDGYDELSATCRKVILQVLKHLNEKPNVRLIGITTRPQYRSTLEEEFQQISFTLTPFNNRDKIDFLVKFWASADTFASDAAKESALESYAKRLIETISSEINDNYSELTGVPLLVRMLGEVYEEDARSYLNDKVVTACEILFIYDLFVKFIEKKRQIFTNEKTRTIGLSFADNMLDFLSESQTQFAISIILGGRRVSDKALEQATYLGIIQKYDEWQFSFIHRTFAEFLTAQYLLDEGLLNAQHSVAEKIEQGQLLNVLLNKDLAVVRKFINCKISGTQIIQELKQSESLRRNVKKIFDEKYNDIVLMAAHEELHEILRFSLDLYWLCDPRNLEPDICRRRNTQRMPILQGMFDVPSSLAVFTKWMLTNWLDYAEKLLIPALEFLIRAIMLKGRRVIEEDFIDVIIVYQVELESRGILGAAKLKEILLGINGDFDFGSYWNIESFKYLKYLHTKPNSVLFQFLRFKKGFIQLFITRENDHLNEVLTMMEKDENLCYFDVLIEGVFNKSCFRINAKNLEIYLTFISKHLDKFSDKELTIFRGYVINNFQQLDILSDKADIFFRFCPNISDIIPLDCILKSIKIPEYLTLTEHCALWGANTILQMVLGCGESQLITEVKKILNSIKSRCSQKEIDKIITERNAFGDNMLLHAIKMKDDIRMDIFAEWIETKDQFIAWLNLDYIHDFEYYLLFVDARFPAYKMAFFEINKNNFLLAAIKSKVIFAILADDAKIGTRDFTAIFRLRDEIYGSTLLHKIIVSISTKDFVQWFQLFQRKCTNRQDIWELFRIRNAHNKTAIDMIKYNKNTVEPKRRTLSAFFKDDLNEDLERVLAVAKN